MIPSYSCFSSIIIMIRPVFFLSVNDQEKSWCGDDDDDEDEDETVASLSLAFHLLMLLILHYS